MTVLKPSSKLRQLAVAGALAFTPVAASAQGVNPGTSQVEAYKDGVRKVFTMPGAYAFFKGSLPNDCSWKIKDGVSQSFFCTTTDSADEVKRTVAVNRLKALGNKADIICTPKRSGNDMGNCYTKSGARAPHP